jgi:hypothetical protein
MTTRIAKVITAIDTKGNAFSEQHTETLVDGKWLPNDPTPLDSLTVWGEKFSAAVQAEKAELVAAHKTAIKTLEDSVAEKTATIATLEARLQRLLTELPFNPREINVGAFKARLFSVLETEDVVRLYAAQPDSTLEQIAATITNWDQAFPIRLDSQELLQPLGYLVAINLLTTDEVAFLRKDCTLSEAFVAPI